MLLMGEQTQTAEMYMTVYFYISIGDPASHGSHPILQVLEPVHAKVMFIQVSRPLLLCIYNLITNTDITTLYSATVAVYMFRCCCPVCADVS